MTLEIGTVQRGYVEEKQGSKWLVRIGEEQIEMNESDCLDSIEAGQTVDLFFYLNRRGEKTATMFIPTVTVDTFGFATVLRTERQEGAYVDIGSTIEVLVDRTDLPRLSKLWPKQGDRIFMTLRTDPAGTIFGRLATEDRVMERVAEAPKELFNQNVTAYPYRLLPVGTFLLTEEPLYRIFVHESERKEEPRLGEELSVRIVDVKEDGTLNGSLLPRKEERLDDDAEVIWDYLNTVGGRMPFTDKSDPVEIKEMFQMSKGAFKRALGRLMKERKVVQQDGWTEIVK